MVVVCLDVDIVTFHNEGLMGLAEVMFVLEELLYHVQQVIDSVKFQ